MKDDLLLLVGDMHDLEFGGEMPSLEDWGIGMICFIHFPGDAYLGDLAIVELEKIHEQIHSILGD